MTNRLPVEPGHEDRAVMGMGNRMSRARRTRYQVAVDDAGLAVADRPRRALETPLGRVEADHRRRAREDRELAKAAA